MSLGSAIRRGLPGAVALLLFLAGCANDSEKLAEHLAAADAYQANGELEEAGLELMQALRLDPQRADTNLKLARLAERGGDHGQSLYYFEETFRLDPDSSEAVLGIVSIVQGTDGERARELVDDLVAKNPGDPLAHVASSGMALLEEDLETALTAILTAVELAPDEPAVQLQLGLVHEVRIRALHLAKEDVPEDLYTDAIAAFRKTRELATGDDKWPTHLRSWMEEANTHARWTGHREQLRVVVAEAFEAVHDAPQEIRVAQIGNALRLGRQLRDPELIVWSLERTVEVSPGNLNAWGDLALMRQKSDGEGLAVLTRLTESQPGSARAHAIYARLMGQLGQREEAIAYLNPILGKIESDRSPIYSQLVALQVKNDAIADAKGNLDELIAIDPDSTFTLRSTALIASAENDTEASVRALTRWIEVNEDLTALRMLGQLELRRGNPQAALDVADRALELARQRRERPKQYLCLRGMALLRVGQRASAMRTLNRARQSAGAAIPGCRISFIQALYRSGRDEQALKVLEIMLEASPTRESVMLFAAREGERDPERARTLLETAAAKAPADAGLVARLVKLDLVAEQHNAALARAKAAVEANPDSPGMSLLLGRTLAASQKDDEAIAVLESTLERWPSVPGTSSSLLALLRRLGRLDEARETLEQLHAKGTLPPGSRVMLARLHVRDGDDPGAVELLESALAEQPELTSAANDLAYLFARRGENLERATELAQVARGREPESPSIADTLGLVFHGRGLYNAALVQFDEAIDLAEPQSPAWATANFHRGLALRDTDRSEEAIVAVERALASGTDFPEAEAARTIIQELSAPATDES